MDVERDKMLAVFMTIKGGNEGEEEEDEEEEEEEEEEKVGEG